MKIIKLNAINSTNSFLKELNKSSTLENFTVVVTDNQTKGRGQINTSWTSEPHKNLTFSVLLNDLNIKIEESKFLNFAVSLSILETLNSINIPKIAIKWPNDIMSANDKICGILIENSLSKKIIKNSIVGIGLNVNQTKFENLINVSSIKKIKGRDFDLEDLLKIILKNLKNNIELINTKKLETLEKNYLKSLYKLNTISRFKDKDEHIFNGVIVGVSKNGNLKLRLENNSIKEFGLKEIKFL